MSKKPAPAGRWSDEMWDAPRVLEWLLGARPERDPPFPSEHSAFRAIERNVKSGDIYAEGRDAWFWRGKLMVEGELEAARFHDRIDELEIRRAPDGQIVLAPARRDPFAMKAPGPDDPAGLSSGWRELTDYRLGEVRLHGNATRGISDLHFRAADVRGAAWPEAERARRPSSAIKQEPPPDWYEPPQLFPEPKRVRNARWKRSLVNCLRENPDWHLSDGIRIIAKLEAVGDSRIRKAVPKEPVIRASKPPKTIARSGAENPRKNSGRIVEE